MNIQLTPGADHFLKQQQRDALTIASLVFSSCCSGPLPPEVKPGVPQDTDGFTEFKTSAYRVFFDSLLDPRQEIVIDVKDYGSYRELFIQGWE